MSTGAVLWQKEQKMKRLTLLAFCFSSISCVVHEIGEPEKSGAAPALTFEEETRNALKKLNPYQMYDSNVPVDAIWDNINFKTINYSSFFYSACPAANRAVSGEELRCDLSLPNRFRQFSIKKNGDRIEVKIERFGSADFYLAAKWVITEKSNGFSVTRYEKKYREYSWAYLIVDSEYRIDGRGHKLAASGEIGSTLLGRYSFTANDICFKRCQNVPDGSIYVEAGNNQAVASFTTGNCDDYVRIKINDLYGKYKYKYKWTLRDLFDYLTPYL